MTTKLTLGHAKDMALKKGGRCLSATYTNNEIKLLWQCQSGHEWKTSYNSIRGGTWCPFCAGKARLTIEKMQGVAKKYGGVCLSSEYKNLRTKLLWQCKEGHEWHAVPHHVNRGHWCPTCAGVEPLTLEDMKKIAIERGGRCLSKKYVNNRTLLIWECKGGHQWKAQPSNIKLGNWCKTCAGLDPITIDEMQTISKKRGGACLSEKCTNNRDKLNFRCAKGHEWHAKPAHIKSSNSWCPQCGYDTAAEKMKLDISEAHDIARLRGGRCLSEEYKNNRTKLFWECKYGHQWKASIQPIKSGRTWCPVCSNHFVSEEIVREIFENIYKVKFFKSKPKWLRGGKGYLLELDGYNEELAIAFEYHGEQHFNADNYHYRFDVDKIGALNKRMETDALKRELCKKNSVRLIEIPYTVKSKNYLEYIIAQLK